MEETLPNIASYFDRFLKEHPRFPRFLECDSLFKEWTKENTNSTIFAHSLRRLLKAMEETLPNIASCFDGFLKKHPRFPRFLECECLYKGMN